MKSHRPHKHNIPHFESNAKASGLLSEHITYMDCIKGNVRIPKTGNGLALFQIMMTGGMVLFMVTINGVRNTGLEFLAQSHWLYPLIFCISFTIRALFAGKMGDMLCEKLVDGKFHGTTDAMLRTIINTCCMAPIMCAIVTPLINGFDDCVIRYFTTLPFTLPAAMFVNFFIVGPVVKKIFFNRISPAMSFTVMSELRNNIAILSRIFGFN